MMNNDVTEEIFPILKEIKSEELRKKVMDTWEEALEGDIEKLDKPFTRLVSTNTSLKEHTRLVAELSYEVGGKLGLDTDTIIAGALLHDLGKVLDSKLLTHAISGANLAVIHELPEEVVHIIATHSKEGELIDRTEESIVVHHCDFILFEIEGRRYGR